jgi:two-component system nitrate/nitrite response regulator NarL
MGVKSRGGKLLTCASPASNIRIDAVAIDGSSRSSSVLCNSNCNSLDLSPQAAERCSGGVRGEQVCIARARCDTAPSGSAKTPDCDPRTVAIVDDHPLYRGGIIQALLEASCFDVIAEGHCKDDAVEIAERHLPDLLILDLRIPGGGVEAALEVCKVAPATRVMILTVSDLESDVLACLQAGVLGYVLKGVSASDLVNMAKAVCRGETIVTPSLAGRLLTSMHRRSTTRAPTDDIHELTPREDEILELVAQGMTNKEVARALQLTEKTVKHYMTNIMLKLGVRNRVEATLMRGGGRSSLSRS